MKDHGLSVDELLKAIQDIQDECHPEKAYLRDPAKARMEDMKKGRGVLVLNPEIDELLQYHGCIVDKDEEEYRVLVDTYMKGSRHTNEETGEEEMVAGYWISPLAYGVPHFNIPIRVDPSMPEGTFRIEQPRVIDDEPV